MKTLRTVFCLLFWLCLAPVQAQNVSPTFAKEIAPLVFVHCAPCHHTDGAGPFPLLSYNDVKRRAMQIGQVTQRRFMPPWKAAADNGPFHDSRRLSDADLAFLLRWIAEGTKEGNPAETPKPPAFTDGWQLGKPDVIVEMPVAAVLPAETSDNSVLNRAFLLPLNLQEEKWVRAVQFRPQSPGIVRTASLFCDDSGKARKYAAAASDRPGYFVFRGGLETKTAGSLADWTPGRPVRPFPANTAKRLPKGSDLVLILRLHPNGKEEREKMQIGLYFAPKPPVQTSVTLSLGARELFLKPFKTARIRDTFVLPVAVRLLTLTPNAQATCTDVRVTAVLPDGTSRPLLTLREWDSDWRMPFSYAVPPVLPAGTQLVMEFFYDNTAKAPQNLSSHPFFVRPGFSTSEEMASLWLEMRPERPADIATLRNALPDPDHRPQIEQTTVHP